METGSYSWQVDRTRKDFCSTAHGSGRTMSRTKAKHMVRGRELLRKLEESGIYVRTG